MKHSHPCSTPGCTRPAHARGLCINCYHRAAYHGELEDHPREVVSRAEALHYLALLEEPFTIDDVESALEVTQCAAQEWLRRLRVSGDVVRIGWQGRRVVYRMANVACDESRRVSPVSWLPEAA